MISQRHLNLSISQRTVLVSTDMVRAALGVDADTVAAKVDAGELRWVWNVAAGREIPEWRFWAKEIIAPETTASLTVEQALNQILGELRLSWRGTEIQHLLLVSRPTVKKLHDEGALVGDIVNGTFNFRRAVVAAFLRTRLAGAVPAPAKGGRDAVTFHPASAEERDNGRGKSGEASQGVNQSPKKALSQSLKTVRAAG